MRLKFLQSVVAVSWCYQPGEIHDVPEPAASAYIKAEIAVLADDEPVEAATVGASDTRAVLPRAKGRP